MDFKLEVIVIPVSDVERAKDFYKSMDWRLDADVSADNFRLVQMTPPGSPCSVHFGQGVATSAPGSAQALHLAVRDIDAAREELVGRGVAVSEVFHAVGGAHTGMDEPYLLGRLRVTGPDPEHRSYRSFASFSDPDGNGWLFQEITGRLPGRVEGNTAFGSATDLASALRRAAAAHGEHEKRTGAADPQGWPDWYAAYVVAEQAGKPLPT